jgi:hypothetical protein
MVVGDDRPEITQFPVGSGQFPGEQPFLADDNSSGLNPPTSRNVNVVASAPAGADSADESMSILLPADDRDRRSQATISPYRPLPRP